MRRRWLLLGLGLSACAAVAWALFGSMLRDGQETRETEPPPVAATPTPPSPPAGGEGVPEAKPAEPPPAPPLEAPPADLRAGLDAGTDDGLSRARRAAEAIVSLHAPNDVEAHAVLGDAEFSHEVPEIVAFRGHDFVRVVEAASRKRWFPRADRDAFLAASRAWARLVAHARLLESDRVYRALDGVRAEVDQDEDLRDYVWDAMDASPFVVFWTDGTRIDRAGLDTLAPSQRDDLLAAAAVRKKSWHRALAEKAAILTRVYAELLRRYGEAADLRDLMAEWGGRPDYPPSKRSFRDGYPILVWGFGSRSAYEVLLGRALGERAADALYGYARGWGGRVFLCEDADLPRDDRLQHHLRIVV